MHPDLQEIAEAARGLFYISESDHPLTPVQLRTGDLEAELRQLSAAGDATVEKTTLAYFFRNMTRSYPADPEERRESAERFRRLEDLLTSKLGEVEVWRFGRTQVDAFIIGRLSDGSWGGLRTMLIET